MKNQRIIFRPGYAGNGVHVEYDESGEIYKMNLEEVERIILKAININGYTIEQTKRQKYPRLKVSF